MRRFVEYGAVVMLVSAVHLAWLGCGGGGGGGHGGPPPTEEVKEAMVYVTRSGSKYHRAGCRYLAKSQILVSLKEAKQGYGACSVCRPPE